MYKNIINLFFFVFLTNANSFLIKNVMYTRKNSMRLSENMDKGVSTYSDNEPITTKPKLHRFGSLPRLTPPNDKGQLTWYPIGFAKDFGRKPTRVTIKDVNYIVWRDKNEYFGLRDSCSHQGSSFMYGESCKNTITCPYHGYVFNGENGNLIEIPKMKCLESKLHNIDCYKVVEKGDMVYFNTIPVLNSTMKNDIDESAIFVEPEYYSSEQRAVMLSETFEHYAKFVTVNSLDICHIGFVHTFGNKKHPNPIKNSNVIKLNDTDNHYKIIYEYIAGENSLVNKVYKIDNITVENEYVLPHSTVARVKFGEYTSTIITHALPVSTFKTTLFVKAYRNYWSYNNKENNYLNVLYPFEYLVNLVGDRFTYNTMFTTLKQDKSIIDFIDKSSYEGMHGKFSIVYDIFSNHYRNNYKLFYEEEHMF
jgi:phenylpropionate dioxygenase-like ring-hydroxylating dioxygenase large terminal subunit